MDEIKEIREDDGSLFWLRELLNTAFLMGEKWRASDGHKEAMAQAYQDWQDQTIRIRLEAREAKKTVPMAMLWDIFSTNGGSREIFCDIADRYGYEVTE